MYSDTKADPHRPPLTVTETPFQGKANIGEANTAPRRSVVIPNLDSPVIEHTLQALAAQGAPGPETEVLVVGRDAPGQVPRDGSIRYLETSRPVNPATARNLGVAAARGHRYFFTDADCAPQPGWLQALDASLGADPASGGLVALDGPDAAHTPRVAGGAVIFPLDSGLWALADNIASFHELLPDRPAAADTSGPLGSLNLAVNAAGWRRIGPFDEELTTSEDFDWVLRARAAGVSTAFVPRAVVEHAAVRADRAALEGHAAWYGSHFLDFRDRHPHHFGTGFTWGSRRRLALAAPLKSWVSTAQIFLRHRRLWPHLRAAPAVARFKAAWYREVLASWRQRDQRREQR